jgi:hypothetical protein
MAETAARGKTRNTPIRDEERSDSSLPPLRVRYYRQMKPGRVSTVQVYWPKSAKPPRGEIAVRLIVAGAQVLPSEQMMDAAHPETAVFYVTPLAKGWLRNEKLEVLSHGRKVQEIPMASKVVSQRLTWILLFCTFFVPWFISEFIKYGPMAEVTHLKDRVMHHQIAKEVEAHIRENVPGPLEVLAGTRVEKWLVDVPSLVGQGFQRVVGVCTVLPIAYYAGIAFLAMTLISAFFHMPKRGKARGKPIPILAAGRSEEGA